MIGIPVKSPHWWFGRPSRYGADAFRHPVATVAIDGPDNAAILAAQMLALSDDCLAQKLNGMKREMEEGVAKKNEALQEKVAQL